jgi:hypothetical protein
MTVSELKDRLIRLKQYLVSTLLAGIGLLFLWRADHSRLSASEAESWKEAAFAVLATALAVGIAEYGRGGYEELLAATVETTLETKLRDVRLSQELLSDLKAYRDSWRKGTVSRVLGRTIGAAEDSSLAQSLVTMLDGLSDLRASTHWARDVYQEYLTDVIQNTCDNTLSLCQLTANINPSNSRQISLVSRAQRTDEILQKLMAKMERGCRYTVVSDVQSWLDDKLERFFDESFAAAKRGVLIRRIFVVRDDEIRSGAFTPAQAFGELGRHFQAQSRTPTAGYHIRLYHSAPKLRLSKDKLEIFNEHFGIFEPAKDEPCIHVKVEKTNLSVLKLTNLPRHSTPRKYFDAVWEALRQDLTPNALNDAKQKWEIIAGANAHVAAARNVSA